MHPTNVELNFFAFYKKCKEYYEYYEYCFIRFAVKLTAACSIPACRPKATADETRAVSKKRWLSATAPTRAVSKNVALSHPCRGILRGEQPLVTNVGVFFYIFL